MMRYVSIRSRSVHQLWRRTFAAAVVGLLTAVANAPAQTTWTVDPKSSLAWWQINPHLGHLWATTCPQEPSWKPGAGRSAGFTVNPALIDPREGAMSDTVHVPVYPRHRARAVCTEAVAGQIVLPDTVRWRGAHGKVTVKADALVTGLAIRDNYARTSVLETNRFPDAGFTLDSIVDVTRHADTVRGTAVGIVLLHGVEKPARASFRAWPEAGGTRVQAKIAVPASAMTQEFQLSYAALGLGVATNIWKTLYVGVDLVLRREAQ
jgi:polyisoprenoid-binding protein YceI